MLHDIANLISCLLQKPDKKPYHAIFVSWTGEAMLAIVPISEIYKDQKTGDIKDYHFRPDHMVKGETGNTKAQLMRSFADQSGELVPLDGVMSLENYLIVPLACVRFDWGDKRVMEYESFAKLREDIGT
jgi:hypothetical protein